MTSQLRQNYHQDCEEAINKQINMELYASYTYMSMVRSQSMFTKTTTQFMTQFFQAFYFDRDDVALAGLHEYFKKASEEERGHAMKFMKYQNKRGGRITLSDIKAPKNDWGTAQDAMQAALDLETDVNEVCFQLTIQLDGSSEYFFQKHLQSLLRIHSIATGKNDVNLCDFLESEYLQEQVDSMKEISDFVTTLKRVGEGLGVHMFDRQLHEENSN